MDDKVKRIYTLLLHKYGPYDDCPISVGGIAGKGFYISTPRTRAEQILGELIDG